MKQGILYIVSAPSGTGKSCLIQELLKDHAYCNIKLIISHTTRPIRINETHGKNYFFISTSEFKHMITRGDFIEYAKIFGNYYGTSYKLIRKNLFTGHSVLLDINWQGAQQIRKKISNVCSIFIFPPSKNELYKRLQIRGQEDKTDNIVNRINQAKYEILHYRDYDYIILNDDFNTALLDLKSIIRSQQLSCKLQEVKYSTLIRNLVKE